MFDAQFTVPPAVVLIPLALALGLAGRRQLRPRTAPQWLALAAAVAYVVAVADVTLFPIDVTLGRYGNQAAWYSQINPIPLLTLDLQTLVLNVVMTMPLGVLLPVLRPGDPGPRHRADCCDLQLHDRADPVGI
jgi:glycopeptide antibiotics resistance protein